jgi:ASC-1-like (ASCH) protein
MSKYIITVGDPWFGFITTGFKIVEGRKMTSKWKNIKIGDILIIRCPGHNDYKQVVKGINYYPPTLEDPLISYLLGEGLDRALPGVTSFALGYKIYLQWISIKEIKKYGMIAIQL